jgi:hypothetical protein
MRAISAADAVSPAIQRTRDFLFRPFSWATYLKLGLVAIITEGLGSNFQSSSHSNHPSGSHPSGHMPNFHSPFEMTFVQIAAIIAALLLALLLSMWIFYLITRLRFAFFHCLIRNTKEIRPGWYLYQEQARRFFWMNVGVGFCYLMVVVLVSLPFARGFWRLIRESQQSGHLDFGLLLSLLLPLIPIFILLALAGIAIDVILRDWMLPHYALENAGAGQAWSEVWARITSEKKQFIAYALLRLVLPTLAMIGVFIALLIPGLILGGSLAAVEFGLHSAFADATGGAVVTGVLVEAFFGVLAFGFAVLLGVCVGGPVCTAIREYALLFYGGRYQALGNALYPPALQPPAAGAQQFV